ncbi:hypothetical protein MUA26_02065 [Staphylococcus sp. IVB6246]|uniref:hypothetical protein n=1 Tax=Staphylococcus sp. IVB6246 TaxID=2989772 RepID=UPI0021D0C24B|nr:hypothetical protein [Staphylococcus sp. IVB6246]UXR69953.1 hypothetical protein MUA26_02065 [Staphylococcus sp. IVB6246]
MVTFVILNAIVVIAVLAIDLYRHQFQTLYFSSVLLAITINGFINLILLSKLNFIAVFTVLMYCIWTILQYYLNHHYYSFCITQQKFLTGILTIMISISLVVVDQTGDQSFYMSVPYLAPAIFAFGAIILFSSTFNSEWFQQLYYRLKIKQPLWIGTLFILIAMVIIVSLTPFWYLFILLYTGLGIILYVEKYFFIKR